MTFKTRDDALASQARIRERGLALAPFVRPLGGQAYSVPSSVKGKDYTVDLARHRCQCEFYRKMNPEVFSIPCKHIIAAEVATGA